MKSSVGLLQCVLPWAIVMLMTLTHAQQQQQQQQQQQRRNLFHVEDLRRGAVADESLFHVDEEDSAFWDRYLSDASVSMSFAGPPPPPPTPRPPIPSPTVPPPTPLPVANPTTTTAPEPVPTTSAPVVATPTDIPVEPPTTLAPLTSAPVVTPTDAPSAPPTTVEPTTTSTDAPAPSIENDTCESATLLVINGEDVPGTTVGASVFDGPEELECDFFGFDSPGVWFTTEGNGAILQASTCGDDTDFDTILTVYAGSSCQDLSCVGADDDSCLVQSAFTWQSTVGETYYILLHGYSIGDFVVRVVEIEPPENDTCESATLLVINGEDVPGTTVGASVFDGPEELACDFLAFDSPGVWFTTEGNGAILQASTCGDDTDFDTILTVYAGSSCQDLSCVGADDDSCSPQSAFTWQSTVGETYYILLHGYSIGDFVVRVVEFEPPENDTCESATLLVINGEDVPGTTVGASVFDGPEELACDFLAFDSPGVWFTTEGNGAILQASTCGDDTDFDTILTVYAGSSCQDLSCVGADDDSCSPQSAFTWQSTVGETYYILLHGYSIGDFVVRVVEFEPPENDLCEDAIELLVGGDAFSGMNVNATIDNGALETCIDDYGTGSVWFTVEGTGGVLQALTCGSDFDTFVAVLSGSCGELTCIVVNDNLCDRQSAATWQSSLGETYYIVLQGVFESGDYVVRVEEVVPPENDLCNNAVALVVGGDEISGSTATATIDSGLGECDGSFVETPGVWFTVEGNGGLLDVSTCGSDFDTVLTVYSGSCDNLLCLSANDEFCENQSAVIWQSTAGETYYVLLHGFRGSIGDYVIRVNDVVPPENSVCENAIELVVNGDEVSGSTANATDNLDLEECGVQEVISRHVWFSVEGDGAVLQASTCGSDFDTVLTVYSGTCDDLLCIGGSDQSNEEFCEFQGAVSWQSNIGETYFIIVHGFAPSQVGDYVVRVEEVVPPENDLCDNAVALVVGGDETSGSTATATIDSGLGECDGSFVEAPGVWFTVEGNGGLLDVSTCGSDFDTVLTVYSGSCDNLLCLSANDDFCESQSAVVWESAAGETYYVLLHGFSDSVGDYVIRVDNAN